MKPSEFWAGDGGKEYHERNKALDSIRHRRRLFFGEILKTYHFNSVLELGCGDGRNLEVIKDNFPLVDIKGVDIHRPEDKEFILKADCTDLQAPVGVHELVMTCGFLIHIHPDKIEEVYESIYRASSKYILLCEYYNPNLVSVKYRGQEGLLWKRDFCGDMIDKFNDLALVDYGFNYHRGPNPLDDVTWFLLKKLSLY